VKNGIQNMENTTSCQKTNKLSKQKKNKHKNKTSKNQRDDAS